MNIGLNMPTHGLLTRGGADIFIQKVPADSLPLLEIAERAESLGYDSLWFPDHVLMPRESASAHLVNPESGRNAYPERPNMFDGAVTMGAVAARTNRIKLAPSVLISPYRHPLSDARQFATVDVLSKGRLIMAVGPGWCSEEFDALGLSFADRGAMTEECIQIYKLAWTEPWVEFHGRFYDFAEVSIDPKPLQRPRPPIVYGGVTKAGIRRAVRYCDGLYPIVTDPRVGVSAFRELSLTTRQEAAKIGRDLGEFPMMALVMCRITDASGGASRPFLSGSPAEIIDDLRRLADAGYSFCGLHLDVPSGKVDEFIEQMDRFGERVLPAARDIEAAKE